MTADRIAVDNDIVFKAACFRLTSVFWPRNAESGSVNVLGASPYVVRSLLGRAMLTSREDSSADFEAFLAGATKLEPEPDEVALAAEMELAAQRLGAELDTGESQLAAMAVKRSLEQLQTGDKRAIRALERLLDEIPALNALEARVACLEQLVMAIDDGGLGEVAGAVCGEPLVDKALTFCFACNSPEAARSESARQGLASYISDVRTDASRILAP